MDINEQYNSRLRQFVASLLFAAAFVVPFFVGYFLKGLDHLVLYIVGLFFLFQFSAFYVATSKLRKTDHD